MTKRRSPTCCAGQNGVDPEIFFKTMTVIQSLKPTTVGLGRPRPGPAESSVKTAAAQRGDHSESVEKDRDAERKTHLPPIQTATRDGEEAPRKSVVLRWQRAVAATVAASAHSISKSDSINVATGERAGLFIYLFIPLKPSVIIQLHFECSAPKPTIFNFGHSGTPALSPERRSARMSEIKNGRLGLYGEV